MPLPVGVQTPPVAPPPVTLPTPPPPSDAYQMTWYPPDGSVWPLTRPELGWHCLDGLSGALGVVPVAITSDSYSRGGEVIRHIQPQSRTINIAVRIDGPTHNDFQPRLRALGRAFAQTRLRGAGVLEIAQPNGDVRQIRAVYQDGLDPSAGDMSGYTYGDVVITLKCPDGFWVGPVLPPVERAFSGDDSSYLAGTNGYPTISSSQTLGDTDVDNPGDAEAWPDWVITGPASGIVATNNTTGLSFTIDPDAEGISHGPLLAGEQITISTNPPAIRGPDGSIWQAALDFESDLWPLFPGINSITLAITDSDDGSSVTMTFAPRYETP